MGGADQIPKQRWCEVRVGVIRDQDAERHILITCTTITSSKHNTQHTHTVTTPRSATMVPSQEMPMWPVVRELDGVTGTIGAQLHRALKSSESGLATSNRNKAPT